MADTTNFTFKLARLKNKKQLILAQGYFQFKKEIKIEMPFCGQKKNPNCSSFDNSGTK